MKFRVHPLFYALALLLVLFGQAAAFAWTFAAVCLHEAGHAVAARARGYVLKNLTLLPYGAQMSAEEEMDRTSCVIVGLAGPAVNLLCAALILGLWWLFPATYPFTHWFFSASVAIALFNLIPVYPLDGSRIVRGLAGNRLKAIKGMQTAGVCISVILFALFIVSFFVRAASFTLGVAAVFLFYGAAFADKRDTYVSVLAAGRKNYAVGVREKQVVISENAPLVRLFHHVDGRSITVFRIVGDNGTDGDAPPAVLYTLSESQLRTLAASGGLSRSVAECVLAAGGADNIPSSLPPASDACSVPALHVLSETPFARLVRNLGGKRS